MAVKLCCSFILSLPPSLSLSFFMSLHHSLSLFPAPQVYDLKADFTLIEPQTRGNTKIMFCNR